jgi:hypothetical protein
VSCPTCGHTLARLAASGRCDVYHCERCGTAVVRYASGFSEAYRPKLVNRCRAFAAKVLSTSDVSGADFRWAEWRRLGIAESIDKLTKRRTGTL